HCCPSERNGCNQAETGSTGHRRDADRTECGIASLSASSAGPAGKPGVRPTTHAVFLPPLNGAPRKTAYAAENAKTAVPAAGRTRRRTTETTDRVGNLLDLDSGTSLFELLLDLVGLFLVRAFLDGLRR